MILFAHECDACGNNEERVFGDTWTGLHLCLECLSVVAAKVTNSPQSDGDNLKKELEEMIGDSLYCDQ